MPKEMYQVFLSSTSKDLQEYRAKVRDMLDSFKLARIMMETFGARDTMPFKTCKVEVEKCDALIVIVGNRYGWIPSRKEGGDGVKSITWWEVFWAIKAKKPVYAFLADSSADLKIESEQDRLLDATNEKAYIEVGKAVSNLKKFRTFLESVKTREIFDSPGTLAAKVASSLHEWILQLALDKERLSFKEEIANASNGKTAAAAAPSASASSISKGKALHDSEQLYWREQIHLSSANCLPLNEDEIGIALIAGRANLKHPALQHNKNIREIDARSTKTNPNPADDFTTSIAALLVGDSRDEADYKGILPNSRLSIFQVLNKNLTTTTSDVFAALNVAVLEGNKLICLPLGSLFPSKGEEIVHKRIADKGVIVISGAGNMTSDKPIFPAGYQHGISAAATDAYYSLADFSNYGDWVTTAAPGVNIPVATGKVSYDVWLGTAASCAIVTGIIALMLKANEKLTLEQIKHILNTTGPDVNYSKNGKLLKGLKQIDAFQVVKKAIGAKKKKTHNTRSSSKKAAAKNSNKKTRAAKE